mmetsp:Transcript_97700/g.272853  ORF Transcript_97700/g.272853 Transcript_97700/m.272853 type:complete len:587 (-) Transcript_97700:29-1789(-)
MPLACPLRPNRCARTGPLGLRGRRSRARSGSVDAGVGPHGAPVEVVDRRDLCRARALQPRQPAHEAVDRAPVGEDDVAQHPVLVGEDGPQVGRGVARMARRVHHEAAGDLLPALQRDVDGGRNPIGVLGIVLRTAVREGDLPHEFPGCCVVERVLAVVVRRQHQLHPRRVHGGRDFPRRLGLHQNPRHDEGHGVVSRLARLRVLLGRVTNDSVGGLVRDDVDILDARGASSAELWVVHQCREEALQRARRLVLVEAELEVHAHDREIVAGVRQDQVEGARAHSPTHLIAEGDVHVVLALCGAGGGLKEAEDGLWIAEDVPWAHEAAHCTAHGQHGCLSGDRGGRALRVRELLARTDGSEWDVVRDDHADGALDLFGRGTQKGTVHGRGGDGTVNDVVDLVTLQAEDFREASADLVKANHGEQRLLAVDVPRHLRRRDHHGVEVVVTKLASVVPGDLRVKPEHGAVGVPLSHRRRVGNHGLLGRAALRAAEYGRAAGVWVLQCLAPETARCIGFQGQRRDAAHHGIRVEHLDPLPHRGIDVVAIFSRDEIERVLRNSQCLVRVRREGYGRRSHAPQLIKMLAHFDTA